MNRVQSGVKAAMGLRWCSKSVNGGNDVREEKLLNPDAPEISIVGKLLEKKLMVDRRAILSLWACVTAVVVSLPSLASEDMPMGMSDSAGRSAYVKPKIAHDPYGETKIVVPLTTDEKAIQKMKLRNIVGALQVAEEWQGKIEVTIVLYAKGLTLLQEPDSGSRKLIDMIRSRGVKLVVCNNSLIEQGVDFHSLYGVTDMDIVPSGFAEVAYLQGHGHFVVDPVN